MRYRHLDYPADAPVDEIGAAAIDDLLERGDLASWAPLAAAIQRDPRGALADAVLRICGAHQMYGTSALWQTWIERLRADESERTTPLALADVRKRLGQTQEQVARRMGISQSDVSKLERRADIRLSTLRSYLEASGARVDFVVTGPDGDELGIVTLPARRPRA